MTPDELNRPIEFIIQSQARLAAAQEQDRIDRIQSEKDLKALDQRLASLFELQVRLLEHQTHRLDDFAKESRATQKRHEETQKQWREEFTTFMKETRDWQQKFEMDSRQLHLEALGRLDRILEKLTDRLN